MIEEFIGKFVLIEMSTGTLLEGFLYNKIENNLKLVEYDNNVVIIMINYISFIRIKNTKEELVGSVTNSEITESEQPINTTRIGAIIQSDKNEFSMSGPTNTDLNSGYYKSPEFVRETKK